MAMTHGKNSYFAIGANELTTYLTDIAPSYSADVAESSTMGQDAKTYVAGLTDGTISLSGRWDDTATTGPEAILSAALGTSVAFEYGPEGDATGAVKHSGNAIVTAYNVSSSVGDVVAFTAELQISGDITIGTFSA